MKLSRRIRLSSAVILIIAWGVFSGAIAVFYHDKAELDGATLAEMDAALDAADAGRWYWQIDSGKLFWDSRQRELFEVDGEMTYDRFLSSIHPEDRGFIDDAVRKCVADGSRYAAIFRIKHGDTWIPIRAFGQVTDDGEAMAGICLPQPKTVYWPPGLDESEKVTLDNGTP